MIFKQCGVSTTNSDNNTMKKLILLFAILSITVSTMAYDFKVNGIFYSIISYTSPYTVAVTFESDAGHTYTGNVVIPSSVTYNSISYSVTSIGTFAFGGCLELLSVIIPTSVDSIGDGAFYACIKLPAISIPASVKNIGNYVFFGCGALTDISADAANTNFSSVDGVLYNKDKSTLLVYPAGKPDVSYTIASSVDTIGAYVFGYCKNLTSITIPSSVVYITHAAFMQCNGLTTMFIPASVTFLNNNPFYDCAGMTAVTVDPANQYNESVDGVLYQKGLSTIIYYPPAKPGSSYIIPSTVNYLRSSTFMNCTNLTSVTIPASVTTIRDHIFSGCRGLTSIYAYPSVPVDLTSAIETSNDVFMDVDTTNCVLHVPTGSKSLYASAFQWKGFANIVEDLTSAVPPTTATIIKISVHDGVLQVNGATMGEAITVYTLQGTTLFSQKADAANVVINLPVKGIYMVKVGAESIKVLN